MADVLGAHHVNGLADEGIAARAQHGEQNGFFFRHVVQHFLLDGFEQNGQASGHVGISLVHGFYPVGHADQLGQLGAVHVVVARQDVVDQRVGADFFG